MDDELKAAALRRRDQYRLRSLRARKDQEEATEAVDLARINLHRYDAAAVAIDELIAELEAIATDADEPTDDDPQAAGPDDNEPAIG
jgi:hypothetical protein